MAVVRALREPPCLFKQHGATDNGKPGIRRGRYYCAFLIDCDGNNVEAGVYG